MVPCLFLLFSGCLHSCFHLFSFRLVGSHGYKEGYKGPAPERVRVMNSDTVLATVSVMDSAMVTAAVTLVLRIELITGLYWICTQRQGQSPKQALGCDQGQGQDAGWVIE